MFVTDLKTDFYDKISKTTFRVLLLVAPNVDALCACRILQCLLQCDNVLYTLIPVYGKESLKEAYEQHSDQIKRVIMINCGATFDVVSFLKAKDDVIFYIVDSHRPIDIYNIYNTVQVQLLMKEKEEERIPALEDVFCDDDSDDEDDDFTEAQLDQRRKKREWQNKRLKILFDYTQFSYYGASSAITMFELAWKLSKDTNELLWWAIVGLSEQYLRGHIENNQYVMDVGSIQGHVTRHNNQGADDNLSVDCLRVSFENELQLNLYRHWSLIESLKHTMYTACKFRLWTQKGQKKLYEFLAELGMPLTQCKQKFSAMDISLRSNIREWMEDAAEKYDLEKITYVSFIGLFGYRHKFNAMDVVRAVSAILESTDREKSNSDKFLDALDCLTKGNVKLLEKGIEQGKLQLTAIFKQVQSLLDMHGIISAGPFLYAVVQDGCPDARYFSNFGCLSELAHFLLYAHVSVSKSKKAKNLPLILMTPHADIDNVSLVVGIPPVSEDSPKNFFGKAFEQAGDRVKSLIVQDCFDVSIALLHGDDKSKFFDALITLLS